MSLTPFRQPPLRRRPRWRWVRGCPGPSPASTSRQEGLVPETRQLILEEPALGRVLAFYAQSKAARVLPSSIVDLTTLDDCWTLYAEDVVSMTQVSARRYLAGRDSLKSTSFAPLPGWSGPAVPIASSWAIGIVTKDPVRQQAAAEWLSWFLASQRIGPWTCAAGWLPATPVAWSSWGSDPYFEFLQNQLAAAVPGPLGPGDPAICRPAPEGDHRRAP